MQVQQALLTSPEDLTPLDTLLPLDPQWLLVFGAISYFENSPLHAALRTRFPKAVLLGCSTAGEITRDGVADGTCTVTAVRFEQVALRWSSTTVPSMDDSLQAGQRLGSALADDGLRAVMVYGPGVALNGSALVHGLAQGLGRSVPITGGLAADGGAFQRTWVMGNEGITDRTAVAVGLYGESLVLGHASFGGWTAFGPDRLVTRARGNVLYELNNEPALTTYKRYLGEHASRLPASGLLFPFAIQGHGAAGTGIIRTILGVNEAEGSLTLAGEVEQGTYLRLMQASTERLIDGAESAAEAAMAMTAPLPPALAILVSCIGRKLVMGRQVDGEIEAVADALGAHTTMTGFYSNGEISPATEGGTCLLHNQTMTITTLAEAKAS